MCQKENKIRKSKAFHLEREREESAKEKARRHRTKRIDTTTPHITKMKEKKQSFQIYMPTHLKEKT